MTFPCTSCGCCCKRINQVTKIFEDFPKGHPLYFPHSWDESGKCEHLQDDNRCGIYQERPLICRVDDLADIYEKQDPELGRKGFIKANIKACNQMMDEDGIGEEFRIKL